MTLFPIMHAHVLRSAADGEALFRAWGETTIRVYGLASAEPTLFERVIEAVEPNRDSTISFADGTLDPLGRAALDELAVSDFGYLDVQTTTANLRVWPALYTWVHARGDKEAATAAFGAPLQAGTNELGDTKIKIDEATGYPIDVETKSIPTALRMFHALSDDRVVRAHVTGLRPTAKPAFASFLRAIHATVSATMEIDVAVARDLTERFAGTAVEWQANGLIVQFPAGAIQGFLTTPNATDRHREKWQERVSKALAKAKLDRRES